MKILAGMTIACSLALAPLHVAAQDAAAGKPAFDAGLAQKTGADDYGMRRYVLVILRTGPTRVVDAEERKAMFAGHMANIQRLAKEGKLALAGPFGDKDGDWRGLFVFAVEDIEALYEVGRRVADSDERPQWSADSEFRAADEARMAAK